MARRNKASAAQDLAAGGLDRRLMRTRDGNTVTVSMMIVGRPPPARVYLRFRSGGYMVTRPVGIFEATSTDKVLCLAWRKVRADRIVEANDWKWVNP